MKSIVPQTLFNNPVSPMNFFDSFWNDIDNMVLRPTYPTGLEITEDEKHIYVEAAVPGVDPKDIELTFDKGVLWIKAEGKTEEKKGRMVHKMANRSFQYSVTVPGEIDTTIEPQATYKNGLMIVTFTKTKQAQPKRIRLQAVN